MIVAPDANIVIYAVDHHPVWGTKAQARITQLRAAWDTVSPLATDHQPPM
jgi:hypothetical protein